MIQKIPFTGSVRSAQFAFARFMNEYNEADELGKPLDMRLKNVPQPENTQDELCVMSICGNAINSEMTITARHTPAGTVLEMQTTYDGAWYELAGAWEMLRDFLINEGWITSRGSSIVNRGKAGRKPDPLYDISVERIRNGMPMDKARDLFFAEPGTQRDESSERAYDEAIRRRMNATK